MKIQNVEFLHIDNMEYMATLPDNAFDLAIVDPPYFKGFSKLGFFGNKSSQKGIKRGQFAIPEWDDKLPTKEYFTELLRVSKHQIIWGVNYFDFHHGGGCIVWDKCNDNSPISNAEIASCSLIKSVRMYRYMWNGMNQGSKADGRIMEGNKALNEVRIHPTQKPVQLYKWTLQKFAKPGWRILDTHGGSGSLAIACHDLKYELVYCEINKKAHDDAVDRFIKTFSTNNTFLTMSKAEQTIRKKHRCRTHVRAILASIEVLERDCDPEDRNDILEVKAILKNYEKGISSR